MRWHRSRSLFAAVASVAAVAACSSGGGGHSTPATPAPSSSVQKSGETASPSGTSAMSPDGVTTQIDVPAESTEEQYGQACMATKAWMEAKGGDPAALVEPFLKELQGDAPPGPPTFNKTWGELSTAQQAAVIIAVRAAAEGGC
ncbi:enamine deaminase RidA (YjgF/YER057c/UK114 family) [Mycolicibacterium sp. BK556]|uniref:lipoprotein LpqV n=1 Tax=unclassified Mycolicibacterium TaxID=2636767 RepID=UPI00161A98BB|nr:MULTISPECIES: lipoprotein LpqV [unclassified Mycolicibacterium]MBB3605602.1 enamine deaminase RidA (YjgF/YER057c/UK114 family) [Mycolicibacterium sp. BK556]MBB3635901.1 enamine deaminase RidA (YjgF/YER057c/UK114 family) [Mycolicibacterium sp. BK607]MBB3753314.1 enamine deaminase RidA (YjgF/YER057c/UK114 family) [Mycolicibacterium sp. BK634]